MASIPTTTVKQIVAAAERITFISIIILLLYFRTPAIRRSRELKVSEDDIITYLIKFRFKSFEMFYDRIRFHSS